MTCDFVNELGERCFGESEIDLDIFHPKHDNYNGSPESPYPFELCNEHKDIEPDWDMARKSFDIMMELEKH